MELNRLLKLMKWDLSDKYGRFQYYCFLLRHIPGRFGEAIRLKVYSRYFAKCGKNVVIHEGVRFRGVHRLSIGNHVHIGADNFIQASGGVNIGNHVLLGPSVKIWSINHRYEAIERPIIDQGYIYDPVTIGDGVWLGANVFVLPGVQLPEGCVVTACSLVSKKKYPPYSVLAGNPCRVIGTRKRDNK